MERETLYDRFSGEQTEFELTGSFQKRSPQGQMVKYFIVESTDSKLEMTVMDFEGSFKHDYQC